MNPKLRRIFAAREKIMLRQKRAAPSADQEREDIRAELVGVAKKRVKVVKDYLVRLILLLVSHSS